MKTLKEERKRQDETGLSGLKSVYGFEGKIYNKLKLERKTESVFLPKKT